MIFPQLFYHLRICFSQFHDHFHTRKSQRRLNPVASGQNMYLFRLFSQRKHLTPMENSKPGPALLCLLVLLLNFFLFPWLAFA